MCALLVVDWLTWDICYFWRKKIQLCALSVAAIWRVDWLTYDFWRKNSTVWSPFGLLTSWLSCRRQNILNSGRFPPVDIFAASWNRCVRFSWLTCWLWILSKMTKLKTARFTSPSKVCVRFQWLTGWLGINVISEEKNFNCVAVIWLVDWLT